MARLNEVNNKNVSNLLKFMFEISLCDILQPHIISYAYACLQQIHREKLQNPREVQVSENLVNHYSRNGATTLRA